MARTIDEKVVEMRFDNRDFESNVSQSMSTLDKLKSALNFDGVEKAFSGISSAADKVNLHGMSDALDGLGNKFSALETVAVGALMNIGAAASSYVIDKLKEVSIDQVTEGFSKYGEKTTAVQTIMNATGRSIDDVSEKLKTLNWFTDETSYNFTDMTNSIGKFTSQGVELEDAVAAMEGISTAAALAGQNAQSASRVMYNFSQALGMGAVKLQDWMSVENANMATEEFKQTIIDTAVELGKLDKYGNILQNTASNYSGDNFVNVGNFRTTLAAGWFDSDVLIKAMNKFGGFAGRLNEVYDVFNENYDVTTSQILKWIKQYEDGTLEIEEVVKKTGLAAEEILPYLSELSSEEYELGRRAFAAAQEAKTFEDVVNATKDAVSTGWMNVFEQIFGNYEEAKTMWTELSNELWDIFAGPVSSLNDLLTDWNNIKTPDGLNGRGLLIQSFKDLYHAARNIIDPITEAWEAIFQPIDGQQLFDLTARFQAFTEGLQISEETMARIGEAFEKIFGVIKFVTDGIKSLSSAFTDGLFGEMGDGFGKGILIAIEDISDGIDAFVQKLKGISAVYEIFDETGRAGGKLEKLKEAYPVIYGLVDIFHKLRESLSSIGEYFGKLFSLNEYFVYFGEAGEGIAGVVNIIAFSIRDLFNLISDLVKTWTGIDLAEPFNKAWEVILKFERTIESLQADGVFDRLGEKFWGLFGTFEERFGSIVDWLKPLGDAMSSIWNDMIDGIGMLIGKEGEGVEGFFANIEKGLDAVNDFIANSPTLGKVVNGFKGIISDISEFLAKFLSFSDIIQTFRDAGGGLSGIAAVITQKLRDILDLIADVIQRVTGLNLHQIADTAATVFEKVSEFVVAAIGHVKSFFALFKKDETKEFDEFGDKAEKKLSPLASLLEGLKKLFGGLWTVLKKLQPVFDVIITKAGEALGALGESIGNAFKNADIGSILDLVSKGFGIAIKAGFAKLIFNVGDLTKKFGGVFESISDTIESFQKKVKPRDIVAIAVAIGIITASLIALSGVDAEGLSVGLGGVAGILAELIGAMAVSNELNGGTAKKSNNAMTQLIAMAASLYIAAAALKKIGELEWEQIQNGLAGMGLALAEMSLAVVAIDKFGGKNNGKGATMIALSISMLVVAQALKSIGKMEWEAITKGLVGMGVALAEMSLAVIAIDKFGSSHGGTGATMLALTISMNILALALKNIAEMGWDSIVDGLAGMGLALAEITIAMIALNKFGGNGLLAAVGFGAMAAALILLTVPLKTFSEMSLTEIAKSLLMVFGSFVIIGGLGAVLGKFALSIIAFAASLTTIAAALMLLTPSLMLLGSMSLSEIVKSLLSMAAAFVIIGGLGAVFGTVSPMILLFSVALAAIAAALLLLVPSLELLGSMALGEIVKSLVTMAAAFAIIGGLGAVFGTVSPMILLFSVALAAVAAALLILVPSLQILGSMSLGEIIKSLVTLAGVFAIVGVAGLLLGPITPLILLLSVAVAALGVAVLGVGAGLTLFATGLEVLAAVGSAGISLLVLAITSIIELIPKLVLKIGEGIVEIIKLIGTNAPIIAENVVKVAAAILDAAQVLIPKLVETVITIIDSVLATLAEHSGSIIDSVATIVLNLLNGIATYLPDFIQAGVDIVLSLIEGLGQGIVDNAERAREAFTNLFKGIVEAILIFLGVDKDKAEEFVNIAGDMINGLTSGIAEFAMNAFLAIGEFMTNLVEKVKEKLPEFIDRGKEIIDNLKEGFTSKVEEAVEALKTVVGKIIDGAKSVVSKAKDLGKSIIDKIKGGTEEPESKETAQNVGKSVGDNVAKGLEKSSDTTIRKAAKKVINQAVNSMKQEAAISSPSEVTREEVGQYLGAGVASGLFDSVPGCEAKAKDLMSKIAGTMKKDEFLKEAQDAGFDIGAGYFDGLFQNEEDISEIGGDFVTTFAESAVSNKMEAYDAGTDVGGSICDGLVSQYGSMLSAGEYDASGAIAGISSYAEGGDNAWYTQDVTTDFVTTVADGMVSNVDLVEGAGRTMAEAAQDGFLGAGWNEFQQKAFEPFKEAFEGISGYASDPWFVMNNDQLDEYTSNLKKRLDGISDSTTSVTRVVQYGDMQLASDELEAYQMSLDPSSARAFGYLMNGFDAEAKASQIQTQFEEERQARYDAEAKLNEQSSHGERWLEAINGNIEDLKNKNTDIYLDTGVLAGGTYQKTDELMGTRWAMSRRGV